MTVVATVGAGGGVTSVALKISNCIPYQTSLLDRVCHEQ